jgi:two-component system chemotaxis sensor kinase CheA
MTVRDPDDQLLLEELKAESVLSLRRVEQEILSLENEGPTPELIDGVFRAVHSLKGSSAFLQLDRVVSVSHEAETLIGSFRDSRSTVPPDQIDVILTAIDALVSMMESDDLGESYEINPVMDVLRAAQARQGIATGEAVEASHVTASHLTASDVKNRAAEANGKAAGHVSPPADKGLLAPTDVRDGAWAGEPAIESAGSGSAATKSAIDAVGEAVGTAAAGKPAGKQAAAQQTMRVEVRFLDELLRLTGNMVMARNQLLSSDKQIDNPAFDTLSRCITEVHKNVVKTRMQPAGQLFDRFTRMVRDLARKLDKRVELKIEGRDLELDRTILEAFVDPLTHMVRNAVDHALETPDERIAAGKPPTGTIGLRAFHESGEIVIEVRDDGRGIDLVRVREKAVERGLVTADAAVAMTDEAAVRLIFAPGFSTKAVVSDLSGRGVGMDVVKTNVEAIGATIEVTTKPGAGSTFSAHLPITQALVSSSLISALIVHASGVRVAIPESGISELIKIDARDALRYVEGREVYQLRDDLLPVVRLSDVLDRSEKTSDAGGGQEPGGAGAGRDSAARRTLVVLQHRHHFFGLLVDGVIGVEEIVVRNSPKLIRSCSIYSGHTVRGDGQVVLILDQTGIIELMQLRFTGGKRTTRRARGSFDHSFMKQRMIVFEYGPGERFALPLELVSIIEKIQLRDVRRFGSHEYYQFKQRTIPLLRLEQVLNVTPLPAGSESCNLLLPARFRRPLGLLAGRNLDVVEVDGGFDSHIDDGKGIVGTFMHDDHLVMLLDLYTMLEHFNPDAAEPETEISASHRILIVEDSLFFAKLVQQYLRRDGYDVEHAVDGQAGLEALLANPSGFDLVVADVEMPRMNGFELVRRIKLDPRFDGLPVLAVTSLADEEHARKGREAGFDEYLAKLDRDTLLQVIRRRLAGSGRHARR